MAGFNTNSNNFEIKKPFKWEDRSGVLGNDKVRLPSLRPHLLIRIAVKICGQGKGVQTSRPDGHGTVNGG